LVLRRFPVAPPPLARSHLPVDTYPTANESFARLHRAGWSVGAVRLRTGEGPCWWVSGGNGVNVLNAHGETPAEAWVRTCGQAGAQALCAAETIAPRAQELLRVGPFPQALAAHRLDLRGLAALAWYPFTGRG
jgi:hypothetical protein